MKFNARQAMWTLTLALTLTVFSGPKFAVAYQSQEGAEHDRVQDGDHRDRDANRNSGWENGRDGHDRSPAFRNGFQDGLHDGQQDRRSRHSSRPTHDRNYKNATHGYNSRLGNKNQFKGTYRQAYLQGYAQGFNGRGPEHDGDHDRDSHYRR